MTPRATRRQKNMKLTLWILTWDCFLMYLLKIHEDLYQWNLYTPGWNLRVREKRAKLHSEKKLFHHPQIQG